PDTRRDRRSCRSVRTRSAAIPCAARARRCDPGVNRGRARCRRGRRRTNRRAWCSESCELRAARAVPFKRELDSCVRFEIRVLDPLELPAVRVVLVVTVTLPVRGETHVIPGPSVVRAHMPRETGSVLGDRDHVVPVARAIAVLLVAEDENLLHDALRSLHCAGVTQPPSVG